MIIKEGNKKKKELSTEVEFSVLVKEVLNELPSSTVMLQKSYIMILKVLR